MTEPTGLRARKKAAAIAGVETAAVDLALEHGYDRVTVEMICERAVVSQSSFFNYFATKERAFLGAGPPWPDAEAADAFVHGTGNVVSDLVFMIFEAGRATSEGDLLRRRRAVVEATPHLLAAEAAQITALDALARDLVLRRFAAQGRTLADVPDLEAEAEMVVVMASGVLRLTLRRFAADRDGHPLDEYLEHAIELIHRIAGEKRS